jgi:hypothetical protein
MKKDAPKKSRAQKTSDEKRVRCETFVFREKKRSIRQNMKPKKPSSKYEVKCEAFIFQRKTKHSSKYEVKV